MATPTNRYKAGDVCPKCEQIHTRCSAHRRGTGEPCNAWPVLGSRACKAHGGYTRRSRAKNYQIKVMQRIQADARAELAGFAEEVDPLESLKMAEQMARALVNGLGARLNASPDITHLDNKNTVMPTVEMSEYGKAIDRWVSTLRVLLTYMPDDNGSQEQKNLLIETARAIGLDINDDGEINSADD